MGIKRLRGGKSIDSNRIANITSIGRDYVSEAVRIQHMEAMKLPDGFCDIAKEIDRMGYRILRTEYRINEYCKAISGSDTKDIRTIELSELLKMVCEKASVYFENADVGLYYIPPKDKVFSEVNEKDFCYAVLEVLLNAAQNSNAGTRIKVELSATKKFAKITVCDKGKGMDEKILSECFEPFFSGEDKKKNGRMGLGIPLACHFIKKQGGRMSIKSEKDKGTAVSMFVPLTKDEKSILTAEAPSAELIGGRLSPVCIMLSDLGEKE